MFVDVSVLGHGHYLHISTHSVEYDNIRCIFSVFMLCNVKCCPSAQHVLDLFLLVQVFSCFLHWIKIYSTRNQRAESFLTPASSDEPLPTFIMKALVRKWDP